MPTLITGGLGYIGSHLANLLSSKSEKVIIIDRSQDHSKDSLLRNCKILRFDLRESHKTEEAISSFQINRIVHLAGAKSVNESFLNPKLYQEENYNTTENFLSVISKFRIEHFFFASTAAVYGNSQSSVVDEGSVTNPISPYGESKLKSEKSVSKFLSETGTRGCSLRLFNVVGNSSKELADKSNENLIPILKANMLEGKPHRIFGGDYPTADGTCIRDFIDVADLVQDIDALISLDASLPEVLNIGSGVGHSVNQVIEIVHDVLQGRNPIIYEKRRNGDPASLIANTHLLNSIIKRGRQRDFRESLKSALL